MRRTRATLSIAVALTLRPSAVTGLCRPGVSTNTTCASGRVSTPRTRWRVVCGLSDTMLTFSPQIVLTSDDLPTLGRPTIVTNPDRTPALYHGCRVVPKVLIRWTST